MMSMNTKQVKELTGLTDDQINYLIKKVDALKRDKTQGKAREYSFRDLVYLKLASIMRSDGLGLPIIDEAIGLLDEYWINENPNNAGTLLRIDSYDFIGNNEDMWTWGPKVEEHYSNKPDGTILIEYPVRGPGYYYNVTYYASELAKLDQLELDIMSEEMAVQN